jgi:GT2 family glycosyltransferase
MQPGTLEAMVRFMEDTPAAGASTCAVLLPGGELDDGSHRGFPTPWNTFCRFAGLSHLFPHHRFTSGYALGWLDRSTVHEIDALVGAFMLVRREAGDAVGWWDENYFFYGEDLDFCFRLKSAGWKIFFVPSVTITHFKGTSAGIKKQAEKVSTASHETRLRASRARFNAMRIFYRKHYRTRYPRILSWLILSAIDAKEWMARRSIERQEARRKAER